MSLFEVGRVCVKKAGRESGKKCVVVDVIDKNYALITGPKELTGAKRRRVNVDHLEPLDIKLPIRRGAEDKEVAKALRKALPEEFPSEKVEGKQEVKAEEAKKPARPKKKTTKKAVKLEAEEKSKNE